MTNRYIHIFSFVAALLMLATFSACEADDKIVFVTGTIEKYPIVTTTSPTQITGNSAVTGGNVISVGSADVTEKGVVYATTPNPTTSNTKIISGRGIGPYTCTLTGLRTNTTYYLRAYATNENGTAYGKEVSFMTKIPNVLKGSQVWPILVDTATAQVNASKIVTDFCPNDEAGRYLYIWENSYSGGNNWNGKNFYGISNDYISLLVNSTDWAGCGLYLSASDSSKAWEAAEALRAAIVASPDDYYLHMALKSTDKASHCFYIFNTGTTKFTIGSIPLYDGPIYANFTRDGEWAEFDIPMSRFATALAVITCEANMNIFVALTEGVVGAQLNMDAIYFYKK